MLEDGDQDAVGGSDRQQVEGDDARRQLRRAERQQEQHEREAEDADQDEGHGVVQRVGEVGAVGHVPGDEDVVAVHRAELGAQLADDLRRAVSRDVGHGNVDRRGPPIVGDLNLRLAGATGDGQRVRGNVLELPLRRGAPQVLAADDQADVGRRAGEQRVDVPQGLDRRDVVGQVLDVGVAEVHAERRHRQGDEDGDRGGQGGTGPGGDRPHHSLHQAAAAGALTPLAQLARERDPPPLDLGPQQLQHRRQHGHRADHGEQDDDHGGQRHRLEDRQAGQQQARQRDHHGQA